MISEDFKENIFNVKKYLILANPYINEYNNFFIEKNNETFFFDKSKKYILNIGS